MKRIENIFSNYLRLIIGLKKKEGEFETKFTTFVVITDRLF